MSFTIEGVQLNIPTVNDIEFKAVTFWHCQEIWLSRKSAAMTEGRQLLGKYRIFEELGSGGFATVYKAVDITLDREVALKILDPLILRDPPFINRFKQEAKVMARL